MAIFSTLVVLSVLAGAFASPVDITKRSTPEEIFFRRSDAASSGLTRRLYQQDYVAGGDVIYTPNGNTFEVQWDAPSSSDDFVVGLGWTTGSTR